MCDVVYLLVVLHKTDSRDLDFLSILFFFFFSSRRRHTRSYGDWSSDVCSSDLDRDSGARQVDAEVGHLRLVLQRRHGAGDDRERRAALQRVTAPGDHLEHLERERSEERRVGREGSSKGGPVYVTK